MSSPSIATRLDGFTLRFAGPEDVAVVLRFIEGLAEYERLRHELVATEQVLLQTLFGPRPYAEVVLGCAAEEPVCFALFFHNFSTFVGRPGLYLEDLFVDPAHRGRGYGEVMLAFLAKLAVERSCGRFEWSVLDWNEPARRFYQRLGAVTMDEWTVHRVSGDELVALARRFDSPAAGPRI